jgi:hypothetical protein
MHRVTSILAWGPYAQRFVECHAAARLTAVFARSLYLESEGDFLCIGEEGIGRGPLNAVVSWAEWARLSKSLPPVGALARIAQGAIHIDAMALGATRAKPWHPAPWQSPSCTTHFPVLQRLQRMAKKVAPVDGLARILLGIAGQPFSPLDRKASPRVQRLSAWMVGRSPPPVDLLGLGPGLTPSGDDVLCGVLLALRAVGWSGRAVELGAAIAAAAPGATSPISAAFLRAAAEGLGCEALHATIGAVLEDEAEAIHGHVEALGRSGHTSGWDALAGAVLVLRAFGTRHGQPAGVAPAEICG